MSGVPYHAWTHRPKADGGTDPIEVEPTTGASTPVEWITWQSTTNLAGGGLTTLSFTYLNGNYDTTTPTFDLVSGSPKICRFGIYQHFITMINVVLTAGVETLFRLDLTRTAGQTPFIINYNPDVLQVGSNAPVTTGLMTPWWNGLIFYSGTGTGAFGTPTTLRVQADKLDDGVSVADTSPYVTLTIVRLGNAYA